MGRDKAKDDRLFNCTQDHEIGYVSGLYPGNEYKVVTYLKQQCQNGTIKNSTHLQVYKLIEQYLHLPIPVENPRG